MKKIVIIISVYLSLAAGVNAQGKLQIGVRLNPEFTGIINKNDVEAGEELNLASHFTYLSFGFGGMYSFNNHIGIATDVLFSREGQAFTGYFNGAALDKNAYSSVVGKQAFLNDEVIEGNYVALAELNYIKVPIMLSLTTDNTKQLFFTMLVGPQINFLYNVAQEVNEVDLDYPNTNIKPQDLYNPITFSGMLAVGGGLNLTTHLVLSARLRFDYGFNDAENKDVMVSYLGAEPVRFYSNDRKSANTVTEGLMIALDFKL